MLCINYDMNEGIHIEMLESGPVIFFCDEFVRHGMSGLDHDIFGKHLLAVLFHRLVEHHQQKPGVGIPLGELDQCGGLASACIGHDAHGVPGGEAAQVHVDDSPLLGGHFFGLG